MPITLRPTIRSRERILTFGPAGGGKSTAALTIAKRLPDVTMTVIECNDAAYDRMLDVQFAGVENVKVTPTWDWPETLARAGETARTMGRDDWMVVDIFGDTWASVQDWFIKEVHGDDMADYFLQVRKAITDEKQKSLEAMDGWLDWGVINPQYRKLLNVILRANGHVFCTAGIDKYAPTDKDDAVTRALYSGGYKPRGQKQISHVMNTVVMMGRQGGDWVMTTMKDRGRTEMERVKWGDFALEYLVKVAGWKPATI